MQSSEGVVVSEGEAGNRKSFQGNEAVKTAIAIISLLLANFAYASQQPIKPAETPPLADAWEQQVQTTQKDLPEKKEEKEVKK